MRGEASTAARLRGGTVGSRMVSRKSWRATLSEGKTGGGMHGMQLGRGRCKPIRRGDPPDLAVLLMGERGGWTLVVARDGLDWGSGGGGGGEGGGSWWAWGKAATGSGRTMLPRSVVMMGVVLVGSERQKGQRRAQGACECPWSCCWSGWSRGAHEGCQGAGQAGRWSRLQCAPQSLGLASFTDPKVSLGSHDGGREWAVRVGGREQN